MSDYITSPPTSSKHEGIIKDYLQSLEFFKQRETYHQESAQWYFNFAREMQIKAYQHQNLAEQAYANSVHYLELAGWLSLSGLGVQYEDHYSTH